MNIFQHHDEFVFFPRSPSHGLVLRDGEWCHLDAAAAQEALHPENRVDETQVPANIVERLVEITPPQPVHHEGD